jgi:NAD(P)H-binding
LSRVFEKVYLILKHVLTKHAKQTKVTGPIAMSSALPSILIIGATGRTSLECLRQLAANDAKPTLHAFCRDKSKLSSADKDLCTSIIEGNARNNHDLEQALESSGATDVIVSIGTGDSVKQCDIRAASAQALVQVLKRPQFKQVRVVVVSSTGAGNSRIIIGMGLGKLISYHLRHVLHDHTEQEAAFFSIRNRTTVVRATALTDEHPTGKLVEFGDTDKSPSIKTDREDLAAWIVRELCGETSHCKLGRSVNVTGTKQ